MGKPWTKKKSIIPKEPPSGSPLKRARDAKHAAKRSRQEAAKKLEQTKDAKHGDTRQEHAKGAVAAAKETKKQRAIAVGAAIEAGEEARNKENDTEATDVARETRKEAMETAKESREATKDAQEASQIAELPAEETAGL